MELIISESIKAHPMALLPPERPIDPVARYQLSDLLVGYESGEQFFVGGLPEGIAPTQRRSLNADARMATTKTG
jgi:pyruvate, water dikinase